jgi:PEP-CTERM motif-containing protein
MKKLVTGIASLLALTVVMSMVPAASFAGGHQIHDRMITLNNNHSGGNGNDDHGNGGGGDHGNKGGGDDNGGGNGGGDHSGNCEDDKGHGGKHCHGVPEPGTLSLLTLGLAGISASTLLRRRRVKR